MFRSIPIRSFICAAALLACCASPSTRKPAAPVAGTPVEERDQKRELAWARAHLEASRYAEAEELFRGLSSSVAQKHRDAALLGLARVLSVRGRYQEALDVLTQISPSRKEAVVVSAEVLRAMGKLARAVVLLDEISDADPGARLLLAELLLERGQRDSARPHLMWFAEQYNDNEVAASDGKMLSRVARAAHLLGFARDANQAYNEAERALAGDAELLLWRAELFLEKHDPGHAEEVLRELLERAPAHPQANVLLAEVRLAQALDFDAAERLARRALRVNPHFAPAFATLAGVALRDREFSRAHEHIDRGLSARPKDQRLLSLRATAYFLADDERYQAAKRAVLAENPESAEVYRILGTYAEWEHRYEEVVSLMEAALRLDPHDARARGQLGLNLIRRGEESAGIVELRQAADADPFNVRVYNTLKLYEEIIPRDYLSVERGRFVIRYPKAEFDLLDRYVPELLNRAFISLERRYGFTPETPIGVEVYASRESFSVRTSGLPRTAIQGVCFGRTLATLSLAEEKFNLPMTLWHELAHVFHIQLSNNRVPRWFTEGLAEHETLMERAEWSREHDVEFFEAMRQRRIPEVEKMSRAFTHAERMSDMATAYYVSSKLVGMVVAKHGAKSVVDILRLFAEGQETPEVMLRALGVSAESVDREFLSHAKQTLARYDRQFVPLQRGISLERARAKLASAPSDAGRLALLAKSLLEQGQTAAAAATLSRIEQLAPKHRDAKFMTAELALASGDAKGARRRLLQLVEEGADGYFVQSLLAQAETALEDDQAALEALEAAHEFDPTQAAPLAALAQAAQKRGLLADEARWLERLAPLSEHDASAATRLVELLLAQGRYREAQAWGRMAIFADLSSLDAHYYYGLALAKGGKRREARFELESAELCAGTSAQKARVKAVLAAH